MKDTNLADVIIKVALGLALILIPLAVAYLWKENFSFNTSINDGKFGTFGDFVGGVLGSIWSLCGVILFYLALKEQRKDFSTNNEALRKQVEALEMQGKEFKLQRGEMELAREVSREQSKTFRSQRLDSIYFSLIELYKKSLSELNSTDENGNYFKSLRTKLLNDEIKGSPSEKQEHSNHKYISIYFLQKEDLSHYFKIVYRIIKLIDQAEIDHIEKFRYIKILRSQLSENEMLSLYYNAHSQFGGEFYRLILKHNLLKHLPCTSKITFQEYILISSGEKTHDKNTLSSFLHGFCYEIKKLLRNFQEKLDHEIKNDDFEESKISAPLPLSKNHIISIYSSEYNELKIRIFQKDEGAIRDIPNLNKKTFTLFFLELLYDTYWFSQFILPRENKESISLSEDDNYIQYTINSHRKLLLSSDIE